jgi:hypothetical protein
MTLEIVPTQTTLPALKANVAGIDIGSEEISTALHTGNEECTVWSALARVPSQGALPKRSQRGWWVRA